MKYSIGIGTFVKRFENYFKPLIKQIKQYRPDVEVIVHINSPYKEKFDENYRKNILMFCSEYSNIFPTINAQCRGFSKIVNTCLLNSSNHNVLMINDDITITSESFFNNFEQIINISNSCFKINGSWSHLFLNRQEVDRVGWMDERYIGWGEEDGDFEWRYENIFNKQFDNKYIPGIINHVEKTDYSENMQVINNKYSKFNYKFAYGYKYKEDLNGKNYGIMGKKLICLDETKNQYPNEKFYWVNKDNL